MSAEDLDNYETDAELTLYKEYRDVIKLFTYVVETERRFYLANTVDFNVRSAGQDVYFDVQLTDAWVWDVYRSSRFVKNVRIVTFKDVNVEEVQKSDIDIPDDMNCGADGRTGCLQADCGRPSAVICRCRVRPKPARRRFPLSFSLRYAASRVWRRKVFVSKTTKSACVSSGSYILSLIQR